jgi:hypothetical protein
VEIPFPERGGPVHVKAPREDRAAKEEPPETSPADA